MHSAHRLYERLGFVRRTDLDWVVRDNPDGTVTPVDHAPDADAGEVHLLGYSWDMARPLAVAHSRPAWRGGKRR